MVTAVVLPTRTVVIPIIVEGFVNIGTEVRARWKRAANIARIAQHTGRRDETPLLVMRLPSTCCASSMSSSPSRRHTAMFPHQRCGTLRLATCSTGVHTLTGAPSQKAQGRCDSGFVPTATHPQAGPRSISNHPGRHAACVDTAAAAAAAGAFAGGGYAPSACHRQRHCGNSTAAAHQAICCSKFCADTATCHHTHQACITRKRKSLPSLVTVITYHSLIHKYFLCNTYCGHNIYFHDGACNRRHERRRAGALSCGCIYHHSSSIYPRHRRVSSSSSRAGI